MEVRVLAISGSTSVLDNANQLFEELLDGQLSRNKLTSKGISIVRPSGGKK